MAMHISQWASLHSHWCARRRRIVILGSNEVSNCVMDDAGDMRADMRDQNFLCWRFICEDTLVGEGRLPEMEIRLGEYVDNRMVEEY